MRDASIDILLRHDRWATSRLLDVGCLLNDVQLDTPFEIGRGTLRATLTHVTDAIHWWTLGVRGETRGPPLPQTITLAALRVEFDAVYDAFERLIAAADDDARWVATLPSRTVDAPAVVLVNHVVSHSMHHRAQALNMLRRLGVGLPMSSLIDWAAETRAALIFPKS